MADYSQDSQLEPIFPITSFVPHSNCPHHKRIRRGSKLVCMVCHHSGQDHRKLKGVPVGTRMKPDWKDDTVVETTSYVVPVKVEAETRKQKRRKKFADYPIEPSRN